MISSIRAIAEGIPRPRLFESLDVLRGRHRLIWISGPPGAGKTLLACDYLKARNISSIWCRVDENEFDHDNRISHISRERFVSLFENILAGSETTFRRENKAEYAVVFDDYHKVPDECVFHKILAEGTDRLSAGVFIIIVSRCPPPPGFSRLRAEGGIGFLGWHELRLRADESEALLCNGLNKLNNECLKELQAAAEGWAAGLMFLREQLERGMAAEGFPDTFPRRALFAYLASEVFDPAEADRKDFWLHTAFLPQMTVETAETVSMRNDADRRLAILCRQNVFIERRPGRAPVYYYHRFFREFLISRAENYFSFEKLENLKKKSACSLEDAGFIEESADLYMDSGDEPAITRLIGKWAPALIARGKNRLLGKWVQKSLSIGETGKPELLFWLGISCMPYDPAGARRELEKAFSAAHDSDFVKIPAWSAVVDTYCLEWNDFKPLDNWIDWMENAVASGFVFRDREIEARAAAGMSTALMLRQPWNKEIGFWTERFLELAHELPDVDSRVHKFTFLAFFYFWKGDLARFRFVKKEIENLVSLPEVSPLSRLALPCIESFTEIWLEGNHESGLGKIKQALEYAEATGVEAWNHMFLCLKAYCFLSRGRVRSAEQALTEVSRLLKASRKHLYCQYYYLLAWLSHLKGDKTLAKVHSDTALVYAEQTGYVFPQILCLIENAWITHEAGESSKARDILARAGKLSSKTGSTMMSYAADLIEAGLLFSEGREAAGIAVFRTAMATGRANGYMMPPWWCEPPFIADLCAKALIHDVEKEHVTEFVYRQRMVLEPPEDLFLSEWPWPVRVVTLGRFELFLWGKQVSFSKKVQKKPLEMLRIMIAFGGRNISKTRISDILWPDADGDLAHQAFATTLHRLRQILGEKESIILNDGTMSLNPIFVWVDALFMLDRAERVDRLWAQIPDPGVIKEAESLLDLYQGPFLNQSLDESWTNDFQARLRRKCLGLIERLGKYQERQQEWRAAADLYERAVEIDPLAEAFYLYLMECYDMLGLTGEVFYIYQLCRNNLEQALCVEPSGFIRSKLKAVMSKQNKTL